MNRKLLTLVIFISVFISLYVSETYAPCVYNYQYSYDCDYDKLLTSIADAGAECTIGKNPSEGIGAGPECYESTCVQGLAGTNNKCPDTGSCNGAYCIVKRDCFDWRCYGVDCAGKWDASNRQCVSCEGELKKWVFGDRYQIYLKCDSSCTDTGNHGYAEPQCEKACNPSGVDSACDDKVPGSYADAGEQCESLGQVAQSGWYCTTDCTCDQECICDPGEREYRYCSSCSGSYTLCQGNQYRTCNGDCTSWSGWSSCSASCSSCGTKYCPSDQCIGTVFRNYNSGSCSNTCYGTPASCHDCYLSCSYTNTECASPVTDTDGGNNLQIPGTCTYGYCSYSGCQNSVNSDVCLGDIEGCSGEIEFCEYAGNEEDCWWLGYPCEWDYSWGECVSNVDCDYYDNEYDCETIYDPYAGGNVPTGCTWGNSDPTHNLLKEYFPAGTSCAQTTFDCSSLGEFWTCQSGKCFEQTCEPDGLNGICPIACTASEDCDCPHCDNEIQDCGELGVDCGGSCIKSGSYSTKSCTPTPGDETLIEDCSYSVVGSNSNCNNYCTSHGYASGSLKLDDGYGSSYCWQEYCHDYGYGCDCDYGYCDDWVCDYDPYLCEPWNFADCYCTNSPVYHDGEICENRTCPEDECCGTSLIDYPDNCTSVCPAGGGACPVDCGDDCTPTIIDHCTNGKQDCDETGVDVGGSCGGVCGDGTLQGIEQCESPFDSCCDSSTCMFKTSGTECRAASDDCDVAETCTGSSAACPSNSYQPSGTVCRPSTDLTCDPEETCTGSSAVCPTDDSSGTEGIPCGTQSCDANDGCDENNIYYDYLDCTLLCSSGSCESSCGCLSFDTYDCSDCSCSYCGFNQEESAENDDTCSDGIDNDCNGRVDGEEFLCPDNTMSFSGDLMYSTGNPVANSRIEVRVNDGLGFKKSTYNETDSNGHFVVTLLNLPTSIMNAEFDLSIYVVGEVEAIYECHYDTIDEKCD